MVPFTSYERIRETLDEWVGDDDAAYRALGRVPWIVTEKIHGANFCFVVDAATIRCAKRKALLAEGEDFFGHEEVLARNEGALRRLHEIVRLRHPGVRAVLVYGELFGGSYPHPDVPVEPGTSPVQTGVWYAPRVEFCAFDVAVIGDAADERSYLDYEEALACLGEASIFAAAPLFRGSYEDAAAFPLGFDSHVPAALGLPPLPMRNAAEGIVLKPANAVPVRGRSALFRPVIKRKISEFAEDARFHAAEKPLAQPAGPGAFDVLRFEAASLATEQRLRAAVSKVGLARGPARAARIEETYALVLGDLWTELREKHDRLVRSLSRAESVALARYLEAEARALVDLYSDNAMNALEYRDIMGILRLEDSAICAMFRCGSRVYGTATPSSDQDFVAVLARSDGRRDLLFRDGCNVVVHTRASFQEAIDHHSVFALECFFAPAPHRLKEPAPPFRFALDRRKLADAASERARADYEKASKRVDDEPDASRKKTFHAIRILWFALQIARDGRITDFEEAAELWEEIATAPISLATWIGYGLEIETCIGELEELALP